MYSLVKPELSNTTVYPRKYSQFIETLQEKIILKNNLQKITESVFDSPPNIYIKHVVHVKRIQVQIYEKDL